MSLPTPATPPTPAIRIASEGIALNEASTYDADSSAAVAELVRQNIALKAEASNLAAALKTTDTMFRMITAYDDDLYEVYPFLAANNELLQGDPRRIAGRDLGGVMTTHPTRTVTAQITCVLLDDETTIGHPKYEITVEAERHQSWRFVVADAAPYPVGSTITLEVPA